MPRNRRTKLTPPAGNNGKEDAVAEAPSTPKVPVIDPRAVFTIDQARNALGLTKACLPREVRLRRLRVAKRGGRYFILGSWLLEWIEAGEVPAKGDHHGPADRSGNGRLRTGTGSAQVETPTGS
jgi:hypothetical protein